MGLVNYDSDSDSGAASDAEQATATPTASSTTASSKKPFQKLVNSANPGKIIVNLPAARGGGGDDVEDDDDRPAKRARVGAGASRFSGFGSFLPAPKNTGAARAASTGEASQATRDAPAVRPAVNLKTSSEAAFSRQRSTDVDISGNDEQASHSNGNRGTEGGREAGGQDEKTAPKLSLPPPTKTPSIPSEQKAAEDVQLVGNPLMFMPLSVSRRPGAGKKKPKKTAADAPLVAAETTADSKPAAPPAAPQKKKVSLFSIDEPQPLDGAEKDPAGQAQGEAYEPLYGDDAYAPGVPYHPQPPQAPEQAQVPAQGQDTHASQTLGALADDLHLSARDRRQLFGRSGQAAGTVASATFDMDKEYRHNEQLRHSAETEPHKQGHQAVRAIQAGKHSLQQLVSAVHSQREAFEENFAKNRAAQRESGSRYGFR